MKSIITYIVAIVFTSTFVYGSEQKFELLLKYNADPAIPNNRELPPAIHAWLKEKTDIKPDMIYLYCQQTKSENWQNPSYIVTKDEALRYLNRHLKNKDK